MDHNRPLERCFVIIGVVYIKLLVFKCHLIVMCLYRYQIGQTNTTTNTRNRKIVLDYEVDNFCMIFVLFLSRFSLYTVVSCKIIMAAVIPDFFIQRYPPNEIYESSFVTPQFLLCAFGNFKFRSHSLPRYCYPKYQVQTCITIIFVNAHGVAFIVSQQS